MNRWDEISRLYKLLKQSRWADIQTICNLAQQGNWNEVTVRLAEMTTQLESRNLFNKHILTGELKDMYQHYLFLMQNNNFYEANKLYNEIVDILESRAKKLNAAQIDVFKANALHALNSTNPPSQTSSQDVESTLNEKLTKLFYEECAERFVEEYHLICGETPSDDSKYPVYIWEEKFCHYLIYSPELTIEEKGIEQPREEQVFFRNDYYDLREGKFHRTTTINYFHLFCLPYDYDDNADEPKVFDAMLANMFNGDKKKIELSYQIIGAILSDVTRLKSLFVFKGVPHGGKSTLSNLIASFLAENTVESFPNMDSIEMTKIKPYKRNKKLLYVDDAPDKVWSSSTVFLLKKSFESFDSERQAIVKKVLEQFKVVLDRNSEFTELDDDLSDSIRVFSPQLISRSAAKESTTSQTISDKNKTVCGLIRQNYERTDDPKRFTTPTSIFYFIIENMPDTSGKEGGGKKSRESCIW